MFKDELKTYREELERKKEAEIEAINKKYGRKIAALAVLLEDEQLALGTVKNGSNGEHNVNTFTGAIKATLDRTSGNFSSVSLFEAISKVWPEIAEDKSAADISATLWVLNKQGKIASVVKGSGRRPTIYRKALNW